MSAFRLAPPAPAERAVPRVRLVRRLEARFTARVTVLAAPSGYGKTTLLAQAIAHNRIVPRGVDVFLTAVAADSDPTHLLGGLAVALGDGTGATVASVVGQIARRAPVPTVLVVDDVHEIGPQGSGMTALLELVAALPPHAHVLLAGRETPHLDLSSLEPDEFVEIQPHELLLDQQERRALAAVLDVDDGYIASAGGWIGAAVVGRHGRRSLQESVVRQLDPRALAVLQALIAIGGGDDSMVAAVVGASAAGATVREILADVPLLAVDDRGWYRPHQWWAEVFDENTTGSHGGGAFDAGEARVAAAAICRDRGDAADALAVLTNAPLDDTTWPAFAEIMTRECLVVSSFVAGAHLAVAAAAIPADRADTPTALLVRATQRRMQASAAAGGLGAVLADLDEAIDAARERAEPLVEIAAIAQRAHAAWWESDRVVFARLFQRITALHAEGLPEAGRFLAIGDAMFAEIVDDHAAMLRHCESIARVDRRGIVGVVADFLHARALLNLGRAEESVEYAHRASAAPGAFPSTRLQHALSRWFAGDVVAVAAERASLALEPAAAPRDHFLAHLHLAVAASNLGRCAEARGHVAAALDNQGSVEGARAQLLLAATRAWVDVGCGDEAGASARVRLEIAGRPRSDLSGLRAVLPIVYVLDPTSRSAFDGMELGPCWDRARQLARCLVRARDADPGDDLSVPDVAVASALAALPLRWTVELAVRAGADTMLSQVVDVAGAPAAREVRRLAESESESELPERARKLVKAVGLPPEQPLSLRVLGPLELRRAGVPVVDADWHRGRVRALLALLVLRSRVTRAEAGSTLWPDLEPEAASANLRTTLRYLHRTLEPDRIPGSAPWFVRSNGDVLVLHARELDIDSRAMQAAFERARQADRSGHIDEALRSFDAGFQLWQGEFLAEIYDDWAVVERERIRAVALAATVRAGELRLGRNEPDTALAYGARLLEAEPWSEPGHRLVIAAHLARRDRASAGRALARCLRAIAEFGVEPEPETVMMERAVRGTVS